MKPDEGNNILQQELGNPQKSRIMQLWSRPREALSRREVHT
jgi:hypothetical protein